MWFLSLSRRLNRSRDCGPGRAADAFARRMPGFTRGMALLHPSRHVGFSVLRTTNRSFRLSGQIIYTVNNLVAAHICPLLSQSSIHVNSIALLIATIWLRAIMSHSGPDEHPLQRAILSRIPNPIPYQPCPAFCHGVWKRLCRPFALSSRPEVDGQGSQVDHA